MKAHHTSKTSHQMRSQWRKNKTFRRRLLLASTNPNHNLKSLLLFMRVRARVLRSRMLVKKLEIIKLRYNYNRKPKVQRVRLSHQLLQQSQRQWRPIEVQKKQRTRDPNSQANQKLHRYNREFQVTSSRHNRFNKAKNQCTQIQRKPL